MASSRVFASNCRSLMAAAKSAAKATTTTTAPKAKSSNAGILKVQNVSPALAKFIGSSEASRSGAVKKIWEIRTDAALDARAFVHKCVQTQMNPTNKREIYCDDTLKTIFDGKEKVDFPEIAKLLSNHFPKAA